jgi:hypothetical protein
MVGCGPVVITTLPDVDTCASAGIDDKNTEVPNRRLAFVHGIGMLLFAGAITESLINRDNTPCCHSLARIAAANFYC